MSWLRDTLGPFVRGVSRLVTEAAGAAASGAAAAYTANPQASGEQIGTAAASAAAVFVLGRLLPQLKLRTE